MQTWGGPLFFMQAQKGGSNNLVRVIKGGGDIIFNAKLLGSRSQSTVTLCDYCSLNEKCCPGINRVSRKFPDYESTGLHYLPMNKTPMANRITDDFHPRVQLTKVYALDECTLDNPNKILEFSKKFVVSEECIRSNLEHLKLLDLKKEK